MIGPRVRRSIRPLALVVTAGAMVACSSDAGGTAGAGEPLDTVVSFYPLQFVVERVGGDAVRVRNVTPPGAEPHDVELAASDVRAITDADLVVHLAGFAPAVDDAVRDLDDDVALDVTDAARLLGGSDRADDEHDDEGQQDDHGDEHAGDPHFWLDPSRLADVADAIADRLSALRPAESEGFADRAAALRAELEVLDGEYRDGLERCQSTDLVTSHAAFGYLAERYRFTQLGISGLSPDEEPSPAKLAEVARFVREHAVGTIYFETLVDPDVARTVARETGAATAVLDPVEGLTEAVPGADYLTVMRSNLAVLRSGQRCG